MSRPVKYSKILMGVHLFVCLVWLYAFLVPEGGYFPGWMAHIILWSIIGVQFTWGVTVGLFIGPKRQRRPLLWSSLLLLFMPLIVVGFFLRLSLYYQGPLITIGYLVIFSSILACETWCGVLQGIKWHSKLLHSE